MSGPGKNKGIYKRVFLIVILSILMITVLSLLVVSPAYTAPLISFKPVSVTPNPTIYKPSFTITNVPSTTWTPTPTPKVTFRGHVYYNGVPQNGAYVYVWLAPYAVMNYTPCGTSEPGGYVLEIEYHNAPAYIRANYTSIKEEYYTTIQSGGTVVHDFYLSDSTPTPSPGPADQTPSPTAGMVATPEASSTVIPTPTAISDQTQSNVSIASPSPAAAAGFEVLLAMMGMLGAIVIVMKKG